MDGENPSLAPCPLAGYAVQYSAFIAKLPGSRRRGRRRIAFFGTIKSMCKETAYYPFAPAAGAKGRRFAISFARMTCALLLGALAALPTGGAMAQPTTPPPPETRLPPISPETEATALKVLPLEELRAFTEAFHYIREAYVEQVDDRTLFRYAILGMLRELDPHSSYLDPTIREEMEISLRGEFSGIGVEVLTRNGAIEVVSPIDDTPAARAGLRSGDRIIAVDGMPTWSMDLEEAVNILRGPQGSEVKISIFRKGESAPIEISLVREIIKVRSVSGRQLAPGYAYVRISQFQRSTGDDLAKLLEQQQGNNGPLKGLVLDLRNNPGGLLSSAAAVADHFLEKGSIVYTKGRGGQVLERSLATPGDSIGGAPTVVLINSGSASAAEIVAGALQDHQRAVVMGTTSFGKGSVQEVVELPEGRALKLTTALYYTPSGRSIQASGIEPDVKVERMETTAVVPSSAPREADLPGHLPGSNEKPRASAPQNPSEADQLLAKDNQLREALTLLRGLNILGKK